MWRRESGINFNFNESARFVETPTTSVTAMIFAITIQRETGAPKKKNSYLSLKTLDVRRSQQILAELYFTSRKFSPPKKIAHIR